MGLFRKDTKLERKNKAQRILLKSGWIEKYYYIIKVIKSCDSSNNIQSVMKARRWGIDILRRDYDLICKTPKAKKVQSELYDIFFAYTETLYNYYNEVFDKIVDNIKDFNADEHRTL